MRTRQWQKTARISPLDVYTDIDQHIATRDPKNMSHAIPVMAYLTLLETHRQAQTAIPPHSCTVCYDQCVFVPFVSQPEALGGCPVSEPLVWSLGGKRYHS